MRVFIIKSVNLLIVAGIIALYCINVRKVGEEKKAIAEKTDKKKLQVMMVITFILLMTVFMRAAVTDLAER